MQSKGASSSESVILTCIFHLNKLSVSETIYIIAKAQDAVNYKFSLSVSKYFTPLVISSLRPYNSNHEQQVFN